MGEFSLSIIYDRSSVETFRWGDGRPLLALYRISATPGTTPIAIYH
jgi:hypothetical protein